MTFEYAIGPLKCILKHSLCITLVKVYLYLLTISFESKLADNITQLSYSRECKWWWPVSLPASKLKEPVFKVMTKDSKFSLGGKNVTFSFSWLRDPVVSSHGS